MPDDLAARLTIALSGALSGDVVGGGVVGGEVVAVEGLHRLSGGASRETWAFDTVDAGGVRAALILRRDPPGAPAKGMVREARLLTAAAAAGVPVPAVLTSDDDPAVLGSAFLVMARVDGETIPRRILRDDEYAAARPLLARQCGEALAHIHTIPFESVPGLEEGDELARWREVLDTLGRPHPAFELGFRWLEANRPPTGRTTVVHGDFRNGNLMVGPDGLRAVLDWELAHVGDPMEDLAWLCVRAWRFGVDRAVGGFGDYDELFEAYEAASGIAVDPEVVRWWEVLGTLKWGVMCIMQAEAHLSGMIRSVELAAIGRRVCEQEHDLLLLLPFGPEALDVASVRDQDVEGWPSMAASPPHDEPTAAQLVEAVREFFERDVMPATEGRVRFHARVARNALAIVGRQLAVGSLQAEEHAAALKLLGVADEAELAAAIRSGDFEDWAAVTTVVAATVRAKLAVSNPKHLILHRAR